MSAAERFQALVIKDKETGIVIELSISVDLYKTFLTDSMFAEGISDKKKKRLEGVGTWKHRIRDKMIKQRKE